VFLREIAKRLDTGLEKKISDQDVIAENDCPYQKLRKR